MNSPTTAKCPKCEKIVSNAIAGHTTILVPGGSTLHGLTFACPHCSTLLGMQLDPIALKHDTADEVVRKLKK